MGVEVGLVKGAMVNHILVVVLAAGWIMTNLVPRAFARFRGSGMGSKGPGKHWSRDSKNIGHFCNPGLIKVMSSRGGGGMNN